MHGAEILQHACFAETLELMVAGHEQRLQTTAKSLHCIPRHKAADRLLPLSSQCWSRGAHLEMRDMHAASFNAIQDIVLQYAAGPQCPVPP